MIVGVMNRWYWDCRYIRLKRHNTTVFMHCEPADNFASIKAKASKLMNIEQGQMGLFATRDKVSEKSENAVKSMNPPDDDKNKT